MLGQIGQHSGYTLHNSISLPGSGYNEFLSAVRPTQLQLQQAQQQQQQQQLAMAQLQLQLPGSPILGGGGWQRIVDRMPAPAGHTLQQQQQQGYAAVNPGLLTRGVTTPGPMFGNSQAQVPMFDGQLAAQQQQQFASTHGNVNLHAGGAGHPWLLQQQQQQQQQQLMMQLNTPAYSNLHPGMNLNPAAASTIHMQQQQLVQLQQQTMPSVPVQQEAAAAAVGEGPFISLSELAGTPQEGMYAVTKARAEAAVPLEAADADSKRCGHWHCFARKAGLQLSALQTICCSARTLFLYGV
jgi:hypothetical protein